MSVDEGLERFERDCARTLRAFEEACASALEEGPAEGVPEGVYLSPTWETETSDPESSRAWKRSVLRRVPGAGAEPWGHLFLVALRSPGGHLALSSLVPGLPRPDAKGSPPVLEIELDGGPPELRLLLRPRAPSTEGSLRAFAESLRKRFVPPRGG